MKITPKAWIEECLRPAPDSSRSHKPPRKESRGLWTAWAHRPKRHGAAKHHNAQATRAGEPSPPALPPTRCWRCQHPPPAAGPNSQVKGRKVPPRESPSVSKMRVRHKSTVRQHEARAMLGLPGHLTRTPSREHGAVLEQRCKSVPEQRQTVEAQKRV